MAFLSILYVLALLTILESSLAMHPASTSKAGNSKRLPAVDMTGDAVGGIVAKWQAQIAPKRSPQLDLNKEPEVLVVDKEPEVPVVERRKRVKRRKPVEKTKEKVEPRRRLDLLTVKAVVAKGLEPGARKLRKKELEAPIPNVEHYSTTNHANAALIVRKRTRKKFMDQAVALEEERYQPELANKYRSLIQTVGRLDRDNKRKDKKRAAKYAGASSSSLE